VVPKALAEEVLEKAFKQEELEEWILSEVENGAVLPGLYPPDAENLQRFERAREGEKD